jgi:hypothetical protein
MSHNSVKLPALSWRIQVTLSIRHIRNAVQPAIEFRKMHTAVCDIKRERLLCSVLRGQQRRNSRSRTQFKEALTRSAGDHSQISAGSTQHCWVDNVCWRIKFLSIDATPAVRHDVQTVRRIHGYRRDIAPVKDLLD